jgi:uncharacterized DUF497 family protein
MDFDWDPAKDASNEQKHGLRFSAVVAVFLDVRVVEFDVSRPEDKEVRRKAVGLIGGRLITVVYSRRNGVTRIISARRSNVQEARQYGVR